MTIGETSFCTKCKTIKPAKSFYRDKRSKARLSSWCKECGREANRRSYERMSAEDKKRRSENYSRFRDKNRIKYTIIHLINGMKQRCKKSGKSSEIDRRWLEERIERGFCEATGIRFRYDRNGRGSITPFSPSIDCIDPRGDYTTDNTQLVCSMYNIGKAHHDELDFIAMCIAVAHRNKDNREAYQRLIELLSA